MQPPDMLHAKHGALEFMETTLATFNAYLPPPYLYNRLFQKLGFSAPIEPPIAHALSNILFHHVYNEQTNIGWDHFACGLLSSRWKHLRQLHLQHIESKDLHVLDKWVRAFIKAMLEFNRTMWREQRRILKLEHDLTYEERQR